MRGWSVRERLHQVPTKKCPGNYSDYYWNHITKEWVFVKDDDDMRWWEDALLGYDTGPGEKPRAWPWKDEGYTGKQWKADRHELNSKPLIII